MDHFLVVFTIFRVKIQLQCMVQRREACKYTFKQYCCLFLWEISFFKNKKFVIKFVSSYRYPVTQGTSVLGVCFNGGVALAADTLGNICNMYNIVLVYIYKSRRYHMRFWACALHCAHVIEL